MASRCEMSNVFLRQQFEQTVEETLIVLRQQNDVWKALGTHPYIPNIDEVCERLEPTAPAWPKGKDAYRSLRIRFGEGHNGMIQTFEAHAAAIKRVHAKFWRWDLLLSGEHPYQDKQVACSLAMRRTTPWSSGSPSTTCRPTASARTSRPRVGSSPSRTKASCWRGCSPSGWTPSTTTSGRRGSAPATSSTSPGASTSRGSTCPA